MHDARGGGRIGDDGRGEEVAFLGRRRARRGRGAIGYGVGVGGGVGVEGLHFIELHLVLYGADDGGGGGARADGHLGDGGAEGGEEGVVDGGVDEDAFHSYTHLAGEEEG